MGSPPLKTVARAFRVLQVLDEQEGARPSEVAAELGVTRATAHDYLASLAEVGFVSRNDGLYELGYRFLQLGNRKKYRGRLFRASIRSLVDLYRETGELVQLGVEEQGEWVLLHAETDRGRVGPSPYSGFRTPLHTHAAGKVILAEFSEERRNELLDGDSLPAVTEQTTTDPATLRRELDRIADDGYAVDWDEQAVGVGFVACPLTVDNETVGSISIGGPTSKFQREEYRETLVRKLEAAADDISVTYRQLLNRRSPLPTDSFENI
ncbi:IclR family transcriptional regulator [Halopelagius longus]|uniref:IclR family transcriptional regulator n=1 Tax=Halopelagius longus TaxID=1236180 RepID=A0A1H1FZ30_9EURY|nr:IclR family transcriptional regulator [Halopelagius longus]RDI69940.1 IclR family transcriptional regulator [Halopelagius longus]SDR06237.1 transcriptional regulator, IclR family [Halopelagius longus]